MISMTSPPPKPPRRLEAHPGQHRHHVTEQVLRHLPFLAAGPPGDVVLHHDELGERLLSCFQPLQSPRLELVVIEMADQELGLVVGHGVAAPDLEERVDGAFVAGGVVQKQPPVTDLRLAGASLLQVRPDISDLQWLGAAHHGQRRLLQGAEILKDTPRVGLPPGRRLSIDAVPHHETCQAHSLFAGRVSFILACLAP